jgi:N-glycosylase/DNA lyase
VAARLSRFLAPRGNDDVTRTPSVRAWAALPRHILDVPSHHFDLSHSLDCGQAFRWRRDGEGWVGVVGARVYRLERLDGRRVEWRAFPDDAEARDELVSYLRLEVDLDAVHAYLRDGDPRMDEAIDGFAGLRVLAQPPRETLLTFVCSPASNIVRITRSIDALARLYGEPVANIGGASYHAFPTAEALAACRPGELTRTAGLGFRGENLRRVAAEIVARGPGWPRELTRADEELARRELATLDSVGPKIADCVALFGLRHDGAVPVDTHVWGLARQLFAPRFEGRTLTRSVYEEVRGAFRERFGPWAGWAQQYLFHARRVGRALPMPSEVTLLGA